MSHRFNIWVIRSFAGMSLFLGVGCTNPSNTTSGAKGPGEVRVTDDAAVSSASQSHERMGELPFLPSLQIESLPDDMRSMALREVDRLKSKYAEAFSFHPAMTQALRRSGFDLVAEAQRRAQLRGDLVREAKELRGKTGLDAEKKGGRFTSLIQAGPLSVENEMICNQAVVRRFIQKATADSGLSHTLYEQIFYNREITLAGVCTPVVTHTQVTTNAIAEGPTTGRDYLSADVLEIVTRSYRVRVHEGALVDEGVDEEDDHIEEWELASSRPLSSPEGFYFPVSQKWVGRPLPRTTLMPAPNPSIPIDDPTTVIPGGGTTSPGGGTTAPDGGTTSPGGGNPNPMPSPSGT